MKKFTEHFDYGLGTMDSEVIPLCNAMNALPGIITKESCCGHGKRVLRIYFQVDPFYKNEGLFFLTRCVDIRYWEFGGDWSINLSVSDTRSVDNIFPITFCLESTAMGEEAYEQVKSLIDNMERHLNHKAFLKRFNINFQKKLEDIL